MRYAMALVMLLACGCAADEKNYRELERDSGDPFRTERDPMFHSQGGSDADGSPDGQIHIVRTDEPSIHGLDRSHWPTIRFAAAPGIDDGRTIDRRYLQGDALEQFDAALEGGRPVRAPRRNFLEAVVPGFDGAAAPGDAPAGGGAAAPRSPAGP